MQIALLVLTIVLVVMGCVYCYTSDKAETAAEQEAQQQPKPHSQVSNHPIKLSTDPLPSDNITN